MNLRMDEEGIRFRITPEELEALLRGESILHSLKIGESFLEYAILPVRAGTAMTLQFADGNLILSVPAAELEKLRALGRSKHGLLARQDGLDIGLQVDLKVQATAAA